MKTAEAIDDLLVYKKAANVYMLVINAANIDKDVDWMNKQQEGDVSVRNVSGEVALLALQGPKAESILKQVADSDLAGLKPFTFRDDAAIGSRRRLCPERDTRERTALRFTAGVKMQPTFGSCFLKRARIRD
jgi:glycine cleavage system aminomethyltransferase T